MEDVMENFVNETVENWKNESKKNESLESNTRLNQTWGFVYALTLLLLCVPSFFMNTFIVFTVLVSRKLRSKIVYVLVCHLGVVGFIWSLFVLPVGAVAGVATDWSGANNSCSFFGVTRNLLVQVSIWTIVLMSWDKYKAIVLPLHHSTSARPLQTSFCLLIMWGISLSIDLLPLVFSQGYRFDRQTVYCRLSLEPRLQILYAILWQSFTFHVPFAILIFCYLQIFIVARRQNKRIVVMAAMVRVITLSVGVPLAKEQAQQSTEHVATRNVRASHTICRFLGAFVICYLPFAVMQLVYYSVTEMNILISSSGMWFSNFLLYSSPVVNAFVYGFRNTMLRHSFFNYLHKKFQNKTEFFQLNRNSQCQECVYNGLIGDQLLIT